MTRIIAWWARNPVAANLLMFLMLLGGLASVPAIGQKSFPDLDLERITISVEYPGAAPEEVEEGVCIRIEEEVQGLNGVKKITSTATEGLCAVTVELSRGYPVDRALSDVKNAVDGIDAFPDETEEPVIRYLEIQRTAVQIALSGAASERSLKVWGERLRDGLSAQPEISQVELQNAREYELAIEVPEASLRRHGLSFDQVVAAVQRGSLDLPGGAIKTDSGEVLLRAKGQAYTAEDFQALVVMTRADGTRLRLGEIANVVDGFEDEDRYARFDGEPSLMIRVVRVGDQKVMGVVESAQSFLGREGPRLPEGLKMTVWRDGAKELRERLDILWRNGRAGFVLVFLVLALFLQFRLAIWVSIGVPVAIAGSLVLLPASDISIDVISTFAFIMVLGLLVDDAIVVGENVHTHQENEEDPLQGAVSGAQEVAVPVIFGVLTTMVAFLPMIASPGLMGQIFGTIGMVVIFCLIGSLVESQWILPAHLGHHGGRGLSDARSRLGMRWRGIQQRFSGWLRRFTHDHYVPALDRAIEWRYSAAAGAAVLLLLAFALIGTGWVKFTFFPEIESDYVTASVAMPQGTPVDLTARAVDSLERSAIELSEQLNAEFGADESDPLVRHVMVSVGVQSADEGSPRGANAPTGSHLGEVQIEILSGDRRPLSAKEIANRWRELTPPIPGVEELSYAADYFAKGDEIDVQLQSESLADLQSAATLLRRELTSYPGVYDITDSFRAGKQEIKLKILPSAEALGLTLEDLARQVRQAFYGHEAQRVQRGRDDIKVMVRFPKDQRRSLTDLSELRIRTPDGAEVPFDSVARAEMGSGFASIKRADRSRVINVMAGVNDRLANANEVLASLEAEFLPTLVGDYPGLSFSLEGDAAEQGESVAALGRNYIVAMFAIYALLAIPLRSYLQPLIIMAVIPFGVVGALLGHLLMGGLAGALPEWMTVTRAVVGFSMMSIFGIVAASGVVVNASLVLTHSINGRLGAGSALRAAVREAGVTRFRPVVLTSITTFVGLVPMLLEGSSTAQFLIPMACSLAFGTLFSSVISLFLVPCAYVIVDDLQKAYATTWDRLMGMGPLGLAAGADPPEDRLR
ncbi:MAG: efflux RND transporter permease subunit [Myxococcota bacterium]